MPLNSFLQRLAPWLLYAYYMLLRYTVRFVIEGREDVLREVDEGKVPVFAVPHFALLASTLSWDGRGATLLASLSKDGELAASLLARRGYRMVRGSSSRGGREALRELVESARRGEPVGIAFDGPRGPALKPKPGVAVVAQHASGSLYYLSVIPLVSPLWRRPLVVRLRSWDRFLLPLPFACLRVVHHRIEPQGIEKSDAERWITEALRLLEERAQDPEETKSSLRSA